jgi:hypothetical protein
VVGLKKAIASFGLRVAIALAHYRESDRIRLA